MYIENIFNLYGFKIPEVEFVYQDYIADSNLSKGFDGIFFTKWEEMGLESDLNISLTNQFLEELGCTEQQADELEFEITKAFGLATFYIEHTIYTIEGNWLLKNRNKEPNGLIRLFIYWLVSEELQDNTQALKLLNLYTQKYASEFSLYKYGKYGTDEMMQAFVQCFYRQINEVSVFEKVLNKEMVF
jgi:hypothetical protein